MEATLSDKRSSVVTSSTVGNTAKSSGLTVFMPTSSTMIENAMLKVKNMSSMNGGSGNTIIASSITISIGPARPRAMLAAEG